MSQSAQYAKGSKEAWKLEGGKRGRKWDLGTGSMNKEGERCTPSTRPKIWSIGVQPQRQEYSGRETAQEVGEKDVETEREYLSIGGWRPLN